MQQCETLQSWLVHFNFIEFTTVTQHGDRGRNRTCVPIDINPSITHPAFERLYHTTGVYDPYSLRTAVWVFLRTFQRLVFTSDGVEVGSRMRSRKSAYDLVKINNWSRKRCHKRDGIAVRRIRTFPFSFDSAYDSVAYVLHMI